MKSQPQTRSRMNSVREHLASVLGEEDQQIILLRFERQGFAMESHFTTGDVDHKAPKG